MSLRAFFSILRPVNCAMIGFAVIVGIFVSKPPSLHLDAIALGFITGFAICGYSMVINDYYDIEVDRVNQPGRPLPSGAMSPKAALALALVMLALGVVASLALLNLAAVGIALLYALLSWLYNFRAKKYGLSGNLIVASSLAIPFIYGGVVSGGSVTSSLLLFMAGTAFLSGVGREVVKAMADTLGDEKRGIRSFARMHGMKSAAAVGAAFFLASVVSSLLPLLLISVSVFYRVGVVVPDVVFVYLAYAILRRPTGEGAHKVKTRALLGMLIGLIVFIGGALKMWVEKHRPKKIEEMIGNEDCRRAARVWLKKWKPGAKALLLMGPPGTGKTTLATLLARESGMNLVELNASDTRTKDKLDKKIGEAIRTVNLFGERSLIFLDEVDGLLGRSDYGGVEFIKDTVKLTQNPIIMAANDQDADEIKKLASVCVALAFKAPPPREVEVYLRRIARLEKVEVSDEGIVSFVRSAGGDLRHAINSLQSGNTIPSGGYKDRSTAVAQGFEAFFESADPSAALSALRSVSLPPIEKVRELYRCIIRSSLPPDKLSEALEVLSRADMLMGKIMKNQEWRLLRYLDNTLAQELLPVIRGQNLRYVTDDLPFPTLLRIWNDSKKIKEMSLKYARRAHTSGSSARSQDLPFVFSLCGAKGFREELEKTLDLDETYEKFLQKEASR